MLTIKTEIPPDIQLELAHRLISKTWCGEQGNISIVDWIPAGTIEPKERLQVMEVTGHQVESVGASHL